MPDFHEINVQLILLACLALVFIFQLLIYFGSFGKLAFYKETIKPAQSPPPPVSIIVCARNEGDNLTEFLPKILSQDYPAFEVIVVNDCSYDNTEDVLREYKEIFTNLKAINVKEDDYYKHGKKFALMVGIKGASYEHLLLTDADCKPDSDLWISAMMSGYEPGKEIVLGYGPYLKEKTFLNRLIRYDTFLIALQYLSLALKNKAYMGVGRNLSYRKELFFKHKGFAGHYHLQSGDDDLFINEASTGSNTAVVLSKDSFTHSVPAKKFKEWRDQKLRHITTAPLYKPSTKRILGWYYSVNYLFHGLVIAGLCFKDTATLAGGIWFLKIVVQLIVFNKVMKKLDEKDLLPFVFIFDLTLLFFYPILQLSRKFVKPNKWKS
ncbi:MAG: glycosyl transferase family 2 [Bacteroidetes bacterium]|jgi:glycosyltransferase involved in cell wall biosynthesis|nr:glycosyl transferase family 2 [Bacteroidota bacterium]